MLRKATRVFTGFSVLWFDQGGRKGEGFHHLWLIAKNFLLCSRPFRFKLGLTSVEVSKSEFTGHYAPF